MIIKFYLLNNVHLGCLEGKHSSIMKRQIYIYLFSRPKMKEALDKGGWDLDQRIGLFKEDA
jgi:hypothetical protein